MPVQHEKEKLKIENVNTIKKCTLVFIIKNKNAIAKYEYTKYV